MGKRTFFKKQSLKQVANALRVDEDEIETVLETWTPEQLIAHLSRYPKEVLNSAAALQRFKEPQFALPLLPVE